MPYCTLKPNMTILFQGDSITDAGREGGACTPGIWCPLGAGYAFMAASWLAATHSSLKLNFVNRGVCGHRVSELLARWDKDCIALRPDILSIAVGVNDTWQRYSQNNPMPVDKFHADYRELLVQAKRAGTSQFILCEPFLIPYPEDRKGWREDLDPKIHAVRDLAREFGAALVPFDSVLAAAMGDYKPEELAGDGIHPSFAGHTLMARAWLEYGFGLSMA